MCTNSPRLHFQYPRLLFYTLIEKSSLCGGTKRPSNERNRGATFCNDITSYDSVTRLDITELGMRMTVRTSRTLLYYGTVGRHFCSQGVPHRFQVAVTHGLLFVVLDPTSVFSH
jgi:hypothetical protein